MSAFVTPQRLEKIMALASDMRCEPHTRNIAIKMIAQARIDHPHLFPNIAKAKLHPGLHINPEHERFAFSDLETWHKTATGNRTRIFSRGGKAYRLVLFRYKKAPRFGWLIIDVETSEQRFCTEKFEDMDRARRDAWNMLETFR